MKRTIRSLIAMALTACCVTSLAACGNDNVTLSDGPNSGIQSGVSSSISDYSALAYYELENPADVVIPFQTEKIQKVSFKYRVLDSDEYSFKDNKLTVKKSVFGGESAGDKRLRVFVDNMYVEVTVRVVTKVIYTADDFNIIRSHLNGVFVLGADIDFGNRMFWPIGKATEVTGQTYDDNGVAHDEYASSAFEGVFDGMGHSIKNITVQAMERSEGEDQYGQGPSLGDEQGNGRNYNNGIFMSTGGSAQIINTNFVNITVDCQGLGGAVVGANGGLVKNCTVTCSLSHKGYYEKSAGIAGVNGSGDAAGRIENCIVVYSPGGNGARGIADWNNGIIKNCYAANSNNYVLHVGYDSQTKSVPADFDYDEWVTQENYSTLFGYFTIPAFPGAMDTSKGIFYKAGDIIDSDVVRKEFLLDPANFPEEDGWDRNIWTFVDGAYPTLKIQSR